MTRKELEELGLEKGAIDKIMAINGSDINKAKASVETAKTELESVKEQLNTANSKIEELSKTNADEIQAKVDEYKKDFETKEQEYKEQLQAKERDYKIELALTKAGARNNKAVKALLDVEALKDDNADEALAEQLSKLKEEADYLFSDGNAGKGVKIVTKSGQGESTTKESILAIEDREERQEAIANNLDLFN